VTGSDGRNGGFAGGANANQLAGVAHTSVQIIVKPGTTQGHHRLSGGAALNAPVFSALERTVSSNGRLMFMYDEDRGQHFCGREE